MYNRLWTYALRTMSTMKSLIKNTKTPLPSAVTVPVNTKNNNFVTPETSSMYPRSLGQVDPEPPFLFSSLSMTKADGIPNAPLDLSDREWPLASYVADLPPKIIPPTDNHKPPDRMTKPCRRKRSRRRSCRKNSLTTNKSPPTTMNFSPQQFLHSLLPLSPSNVKLHTVEKNKLPQRPSLFTVHIQNIKPCNLKFPPSLSRSTHNVEPTGLEIPLSPSTANFKNIATSKLPLPLPTQHGGMVST